MIERWQPTPRRRDRALRAAAALAGLAVAFLLIGLTGMLMPPARTALPAAGPPDRVAPLAIRIPAIAVHARFERLGTDRHGHLRTPHRGDRVGWYADGPAPGEVGAAVVVGHVDTTKGRAVFWRLSELQPGDRVVVRRHGHPVRYVVRSVRVVSQERFPTSAVYGPSPDRVLRLITCGGAYDRASGGYPDNVVVFAEAA